MRKRLLGTGFILAMVFGTIALFAPVQDANACLHCIVPRCPPCTHLGGGSCFKCPSCQPIPGCTP